jgi:hypothetical protein
MDAVQGNAYRAAGFERDTQDDRQGKVTPPFIAPVARALISDLRA